MYIIFCTEFIQGYIIHGITTTCMCVVFKTLVCVSVCVYCLCHLLFCLVVQIK